MLVRMWERESSLSLIVGKWINATTVEISVEVCQKTKHKGYLMICRSMSGYSPEGNSAHMLQRYLQAHDHCSTSLFPQSWYRINLDTHQ